MAFYQDIAVDLRKQIIDGVYPKTLDYRIKQN